MKAVILAEPVLVGRERELEELMCDLDSVIEGKGSTVFITGEAGSGKTRLANEFLGAARKKTEVTVMTGWCLSNTAAPYLPFVEAFKSYYSQRETERLEGNELAINAWLTGERQAESTGKYGNLSPEAWKDLAFSAVSKALSAMSASKPVILLIEDLHWADSASLSLLHYIARTLRSERVFLLATFRSEELTSDVEGFAHPLAEEMRLMRRENLFREIKLGSLDGACVAAVAENMMGGSIYPELAEILVKESRGNALFVVESLRMLFERGNLYQDDEQWRLTVDTFGIPDKIKDVILRRLSLLKFNQRRVLDAASVIGEKFDAQLLSVVLGQDILDVLEVLNAIARSTSLLRVEENFFTFDHAKSREAIYDEIAMPLKRGYHNRVGEKLERAGKDGRLPLSDIAYHYAEAGNAEKAIKFAMAAGQDALSRFSNAEAVKHFAYVVEKAADTSENAETRKMALEGLGDAYYANCMYRKASEVFEGLAGSTTGAVRLRAYRKAMEATRLGGIDYPTRRLELARKAETYAASDRLENARIRFLVTDCYVDKPLIERYGYLKEAVRVLEEEYSLPDVARALNPLGFALVQQRLYKEALPLFLRSVALYEEMGDLRGMVHAVENASMSFLWCGGLFQEALDKLAQTVQIGEKIGDYRRIAFGRFCLGLEKERSGRLEEAISQVLKALEYYLLTDNPLLNCYVTLATQYAKLGNLKRAEEYYDNYATAPLVGKRRHEFTDRVQTWGVKRAQAVLFAANERWKEAEECFEEGIELSKETAPFHEILVRADYAWALNKQGRIEDARVQLAEVDMIEREGEKEFAHAEVSAHLMAPSLVVAGEEFEMRLDLVNVSKKQGSLVRVEGLVPPELKITSQPVNCDLQGGSVEFNGRGIGVFQVVTVRVALKSPRAGSFSLDPIVTYVDDLGENRTCKPGSVTVTVQPAKPAFEVLPNRVSTGCEGFDALLFGGIPKGYAVALVSPWIDEKELLVQRFLEAGTEAGEIAFQVTTEAGRAAALAEKYPSTFFVLICNPQADAIVPGLPNVFKLKGIESLTEIDIALTKAFRTLPVASNGDRRMCIEIVSDVMLQHHALVTRKWLGGLLPNLKSRGFTTLAVINSQMHRPEEAQAILSLFDGEVRIAEKETPQGVRQTLRVKRLFNQRFLDSEVVLDRGKLEQ